MRVGILTWHKALNHGAVLQAYASQKILRELGADTIVCNYDRKIAKVSLKYKISTLIRYISNGMLKYRYKWKQFDKEKQPLFVDFIREYIDEGDYYDKENVDIAYIGSDMVFNLKQGYSAYMFGHGVNATTIFSYAASAGGTNLEMAKRMGIENDIKNGLERFSAIGCRDTETIEFVNSICSNKKTCLNIDPVLLYGFDKEKCDWDTGVWSKNRPYILVYSYHSHMDTQNEVKSIQDFAKKNGLEIVSCGYYHPWCDKNINASPKEFLEMFNNARYVITDTFHGTVFSLICKKQFVTIIRDNAFKVAYLLEDTGLETRIVKNISNLGTVLYTGIDYKQFDEWLQFSREKSLAYIKNQLKKE